MSRFAVEVSNLTELQTSPKLLARIDQHSVFNIKQTWLRESLVGGWTTPLKNMLVKMGSSSPIFGVKIKIFELPPPKWSPIWSFPPTAWRAACGSTAPRSFAHGSIAGVSRSDACRPCRNVRLAPSRSRGRVCLHQGCNTENTLQHKFQAHKILISEFRTHWYPLGCWWPL